MLENMQIKPLIFEKSIIVDLNNFLYEDKDSNGKVKIENVKILEDTLRGKGYTKIILVVSSYFIKKVNKPKIYEKLVKSKKILQAPALNDPDWFILELARTRNEDILSNDKFKNYWGEFGERWVREKRKPFMVFEGKIIIKV